MLLLNIDKNRHESVFDQLVGQIIILIENGNLDDGFLMPSSRQLAEKLGVNRSTIVRAYEELWALGYLESTSGSYTRVRKRKKLSKLPDSPGNDAGKFDLFNQNTIFDLSKIERFAHLITTEEQGFINFQRLEPDSRLIDRKQFSACFRSALNNNEFNVFGYSHPRGYEPLRKLIINHMQLHSINAADENVLITNGSQNSLQLIFQTFIVRGDVVVIESPTYSMLIPLLRYYGARVFEVPVCADGMDLNALREIMASHKVRLVYTMPTFHNPMGITMSQKKREELLSLCEQAGTIIVEDSIEEEMKFFGKVHLPVKSMDTKGIVIYLGSFSKILSPGLRTAWIIAKKSCIDRLAALKTIFGLSSNTLSQVILAKYLESGTYEMHIRKIMREFRKRMKTALKAMKAYLPPDQVTWNEPIGGFLIWLKINTSNKNIDFEHHFRKFKVCVSNGSAYFFNEKENNNIRISVSKCNEKEIEEGIRRIAKGIKALSEAL